MAFWKYCLLPSPTDKMYSYEQHNQQYLSSCCNIEPIFDISVRWNIVSLCTNHKCIHKVLTYSWLFISGGGVLAKLWRCRANIVTTKVYPPPKKKVHRIAWLGKKFDQKNFWTFLHPPPPRSPKNFPWGPRNWSERLAWAVTELSVHY